MKNLKLNQLDRIEFSSRRNFLTIQYFSNFIAGIVTLFLGYSFFVKSKLVCPVVSYAICRFLVIGYFMWFSAGIIIIVFIVIYFKIKLNKIKKEFQERYKEK